jgi:hypothetical protein
MSDQEAPTPGILALHTVKAFENDIADLYANRVYGMGISMKYIASDGIGSTMATIAALPQTPAAPSHSRETLSRSTVKILASTLATLLRVRQQPQHPSTGGIASGRLPERLPEDRS